MMQILTRIQGWMDATRKVDFLGPLALRLYLVPVFWVAGTNKLDGMDNVIAWFGNPDWGLGLPFPALMAYLAVGAEVLGAIALLVGLGTRWFAIPLMFTMLVAVFKVHWDNGWQAIADPMSPARPTRAAICSTACRSSRGWRGRLSISSRYTGYPNRISHNTLAISRRSSLSIEAPNTIWVSWNSIQ